MMRVTCYLIAMDTKGKVTEVPTFREPQSGKASNSPGLRRQGKEKGPRPRDRGSRRNKVSLDHLVGFQYQPKPVQRRRSSESRPRPVHVPDKVTLHGMSFINVNYKFVVDYRQDYRPQLLDPNVCLKPSQILRIVVPKGNACPICLSEVPVAPRMITSCGHILCLKCLISLLNSEIPTKKSDGPIKAKYRDCPLCASVINPREVKPVLINPVDERFEVPKVRDEVVLTLMKRPTDRVVALPTFYDNLQDTISTWPWAGLDPDLSAYSRMFLGDASYMLSMYTQEKQDILELHEQEKLLYNEDSRVVQLAIQQIDNDIDSWTESFRDSQHAPAVAPRSGGPSYYYYQTGFHATSVFVLSPLDMKVVKMAYGDYHHLPTLVVARIESIRYEELTESSSATKYKYLLHLPVGTQIGFLECNWKNNEAISPETWAHFKDDLSKRTRVATRKFHLEEKNKKLAQDREEARARDFFQRENNPHYDDTDPDLFGGFGSLTIVDNRELPQLGGDHEVEEQPHEKYQTTVWGTKIRQSDAPADDPDAWDAEEMIRRAKEEMDKQGTKKKKKKRLVLLSS